ncbi:MAG TPA: LacI family DNA-binding transcriptional regulator [Longimicrobiales bacterium]
MPATIRDVAREAGVSVATVSRVINESGPVKAETRRRIREVAQRLRFTPNTTARNLSTRRTHTIGVLLPDIYGEFFSEIMRGIDLTARQHKNHIIVSSSHSDANEVEAAVRAMRGRVDGLILMASELETTSFANSLSERTPVVLINAAAKDPQFDTLNIDNYGGAYAMTRHLVQLGHREIRMIRGSQRNQDASERARGFRAALADAGLPCVDAVILPGDFTEASGYAATRQLLAASQRPTAIFAANDSMAVGVLSALRDAGLRVPEDVAVAGFDDIPIAEYVSPSLSTVRVSMATLGARAAERLFATIHAHGKTERKHEVLPTELIIRRSCGTSPISTIPKEAVHE